ncbi:MAG TPA: sodium:solute symporter family protein [Anaeromyxobacter sp.]|nr:sodium:solute symporter family protein [Anaeromyxobacter sp.]
MTPLLLALAAYLALQLAIGVWASRRVASEDDYLVAGRRLGYVLTTFSIFATWFGAETCIASAGRAHREGVSLASAEPFGYGLCLLVMGAVYAVPLWRRGLTTFADLFGRRYSPAVERVAAVLLVPGSILWAAAQVRGFGHVLSDASGLALPHALPLAAGICILYTAFGGLLADAVTDVVQGVVLAVGLAIVLAAAVARLGGPAEAAGAFAASAGALAASRAGGPLLPTIEAWAIPVCGSVLATELVSRVLGARSPEVARRSSLAGGATYLAVGMIPVFLGAVASRMGVAPADAEQVLPAVAASLLPGMAYAIFAGALVSAILSTVDSTLLVASGLVSHNLLVPLLRIASERPKLLLARGGVLAFGLLAWWLAARAGGVFELVEQASAFGSAGTFVVGTAGLFTRWGGPRTALATLLGGVGTYVGASLAGLATPFLASLAAAVAIYAAGAVAGASRGASRTARAGPA